MNPSTNEEVACNGPCRKRFRPAAVNMDQVTANFLLSTTRAPGLQWLCPKCQQSFNVRQTDISNGIDLPPEMWIIIFRFLDKRSLLRVRSTCHRWKNIVDQNQSLRKGFRVEFERNIKMDDQFWPENLFPASRASLSPSRIITVDGWWPLFGARLTELFLWDCEIALPVLLGMLKETSNLIFLSLCGIEYTSTDEGEVDFRLEKLDCLRCDRVLDVFGTIFPRLKKLELRFELSYDEELKACRFMESVQGTLQVIECHLTPSMIRQIATMNRLQLTNVIHDGDGDLIVELSRTQVTIEELSFENATNRDLCQIGRNLPKLRKVSVTIVDGLVVPSFLAEMPQLTSLRLHGAMESINFDQLKSGNLKKFELAAFFINGDCLQRYLTNCPYLQDLEVSDCMLDSWSDLFEARLTSLQCLNLCRIFVKQDAMNFSTKLSILKELVISKCEFSIEMLVELLLQCPQLEKLVLCTMNTVDDEFVCFLGQFPRLKELGFYNCAITDKAAELIAENFSHLVVFISSMKMSKTVIKLLSYLTRSR